MRFSAVVRDFANVELRVGSDDHAATQTTAGAAYRRHIFALAEKVGINSEAALASASDLSVQVIRKVCAHGLKSCHFSTIRALARACKVSDFEFVRSLSEPTDEQNTAQVVEPVLNGQKALADEQSADNVSDTILIEQKDSASDQTGERRAPVKPSNGQEWVDVVEFLPEFLIDNCRHRANLLEFDSRYVGDSLQVPPEYLGRMEPYLRFKIKEMKRLDRVVKKLSADDRLLTYQEELGRSIDRDGWRTLKSRADRETVEGDIFFQKARESHAKKFPEFSVVGEVMHSLAKYEYWFSSIGSSVISSGHRGWEEVLVLCGSIEFKVRAEGVVKEYRLSSLDSFDFDATLEHHATALANNTVCLVTIHTPDFGIAVPVQSSAVQHVR